jgi:hypothetical protein
MSTAVSRNVRFSMNILTITYVVSLVTTAVSFYALFAAYQKYKFATATTKTWLQIFIIP